MVLTFSDSEEHIFNRVVTALSGERGIEYVSVPLVRKKAVLQYF